MPKKKPLDPQLQALVDQALVSGDPLGFINQLTQQFQGGGDPFAWTNPKIELPDPPLHPSLVTVRVDIVGAHPPIWRRLDLRGDLTLAEVHEHLQAAFGWLNGHLHNFDAPGAERRAYFLTDFDVDEGNTGTHEQDVRLDQVLREPGEKLRYTYDFGDDWEHDLKVESVRSATDDDPPARCTGGRNACPPEDVGGIHTWNELAAALRTDPEPTHLTGDFEMYADWLPAGLDPDEFAVATANQAISLIGAAPDQLIRLFEQPADNERTVRPSPQLGELLDRCTSAEAADSIGTVIARALQLNEEVGDDDIRSALRPWRTVLDAIGDDGVKLSAAGWLPPATVEQIWRESGVAWAHGKGNREQHTPEVAGLRKECLHAGLLRKQKGHLLLTKRGKQCRTSPDDLLSALAGALLDHKDEFTQDARVISMLFIAAGWQLGPQSRWAAHAAERCAELNSWEVEMAFWDDVAHLLSELGWRVDGSVPINRDDLGYVARAAVRTLRRGNDNLRLALPDAPVARKIARTALFG